MAPLTKKFSDPNRKIKISVVVPCYNEEAGIPHLHSQLSPALEDLEKQWSTELVFVDDGSTDNTQNLLKKYFKNQKNMKIIPHGVNKNLGAAMRTGFQHATGDVIVTMDSDCTYHPEEIPKMLAMLDDRTDIVTASPYHPQGLVENIPKYRLFLSKSITAIYRALTGSSIYTYTALFRAQKRHVVENIHFESDNFLATAEMLIYSLMKGYTIKEYPTTLRVRKFGGSKMKLLKVIRSHAWFAAKVLGMRMRGEFSGKEG